MTSQSHWSKMLSVLALGTTLSTGAAAPSLAADFETTTPIKHVIVIFQENVSFDHYFGTYPVATNPPGEPPFTPFSNTPTVNNLSANQPVANVLNPPNTGALFTNNLNAVAPFRLDRVNAVTCDQDHDYGDEQQAVDAGLLDHFALAEGAGGTSAMGVGCQDAKSNNLPGFAMGYFDGNTVTAIWNYAQFFAMNDNSFGTTYGPSTPGVINLVSGSTHGFMAGPNNTTNLITDGDVLPDGQGGFTLISDVDSSLDDCGSATTNGAFNDPKFSHTTVGDLLNAQGVTWGWFGGGFAPSVAATATARAVCGTASVLHTAAPVPPGATAAQVQTMRADYNAHHTPFQYYASTANPHHLPASSIQAVGFTDQANHQYDLSVFSQALAAGNLPAVSFLKAKNANDGHPGGESDPLSEQVFLVNTINMIQHSPFFENTAIIIAYDDSDGWYDHVTGPVVNASASAMDALTGTNCGTPAANAFPGRCGYGPRLPLLVISPWSRQNYVDHNLTDQTSVLRFIEDNWSLGFIDGPTAPPKGQGSFDRVAGLIDGMFDFDSRPHGERVILNPNTGLLVP